MLCLSSLLLYVFYNLVLLFSALNATRVSLTGNDWLIDNGQTLQATGTVPGTIHTILLSARKIDEPYWEYSDVRLRPLIYQPWTFTKQFSLSEDVLNSTQFTIHFDQIDTISSVNLNQCFLGNTSSMFFAYAFNVSRSCLQNNNNTLRIDFTPPTIYALNQANDYGRPLLPLCPDPVQQGECHVQFIRKEPCSFAWDWGPAFAPIGIPGDVYLEGINSAIPPLKIDSINVVSQSPSNKTWQVDVYLSGGSSTVQYKLDFQLRNTSWSFSTTVTFNQKTTITLSIPNDDVLLWWPNGHGKQPLYELVVSSNNQSLASRLIGFRTVELVQNYYGGSINGSSFYFRINSQPIYIKGSNWIPPDAFQERVPDEKLRRLLVSAQVAGMNMLRVWGGGIYERDSFYEMADRLGIMLWHDFMFACSLYPVNDEFLSDVRKEVLFQVQRLQSHPSIVLWAGNNENEMFLAGIEKFLTPDDQITARNDYRKLYIETVMGAVVELDPHGSRPFVASSPSNGPESVQENYTAKNPLDPLYGDVHYYTYLLDTWNENNYPITRFLSETGVESMPSVETWQQITNATEDLNYTSSLIESREHHPFGQLEMKLQIENNLPLPVTKTPLTNFIQTIYLTQINQAMTLKTVSDHCRFYSPIEMINPDTSEGNTMGLMYWQLNDIWQAPTWASIEYGLKWKMAQYYVRHAYSSVYVLLKLTPYLASITDENARISLYSISDLADASDSQINCSIYSFDSFDARFSATYNVHANSSGVQLINSWPYKSFMQQSSCLDSNQCLMRCSSNSNGQQSNELQTLFFTRPKAIKLENPNIRIVSQRQKSSTEMDFTIVADKPALFVWLDLPSEMSGYFSRNGFHMFEREITVTFTSWSDLNNANVDLSIVSLYDVTQP